LQEINHLLLSAGQGGHTVYLYSNPAAPVVNPGIFFRSGELAFAAIFILFRLFLDGGGRQSAATRNWFPLFGVKLPEVWPEIVIQRMEESCHPANPRRGVAG